MANNVKIEYETIVESEERKLYPNEYAFVVDRETKKGFFATYDKYDQICIFDKIGLNKLREFDPGQYNLFYLEYKVIPETVNEYHEIYHLLKINSEKPIDTTDYSNEELYGTLEEQKEVDYRRLVSFVESLKKDAPYEKIIYEHKTNNNHVLMKLSEIDIITPEPGYNVLRFTGKSIQEDCFITEVGNKFEILFGKENSYYDVGHLESIILLQKHYKQIPMFKVIDQENETGYTEIFLGWIEQLMKKFFHK